MHTVKKKSTYYMKLEQWWIAVIAAISFDQWIKHMLPWHDHIIFITVYRNAKNACESIWLNLCLWQTLQHHFRYHVYSHCVYTVATSLLYVLFTRFEFHMSSVHETCPQTHLHTQTHTLSFSLFKRNIEQNKRVPVCQKYSNKISQTYMCPTFQSPVWTNSSS